MWLLLMFNCHFVLPSEVFRAPAFRHGTDKNGFSLGVSKNLRQVFGDEKKYWLLPVFSRSVILHHISLYVIVELGWIPNFLCCFVVMLARVTAVPSPPVWWTLTQNSLSHHLHTLLSKGAHLSPLCYDWWLLTVLSCACVHYKLTAQNKTLEYFALVLHLSQLHSRSMMTHCCFNDIFLFVWICLNTSDGETHQFPSKPLRESQSRLLSNGQTWADSEGTEDKERQGERLVWSSYLCHCHALKCRRHLMSAYIVVDHILSFIKAWSL